MFDTTHLVIGAVFVSISASSRFNTPPTNRSSTTVARYYSAWFCYLVVGLSLYFGALLFPPMVQALTAETGTFAPTVNQLAEISTPLLVALLLTVLLPKIPLLAEADGWVLGRLQKMGAIPYEARRLAAELRRSRFSVSSRLRAEVVARLTGEGFAPEDVLFDESPSLKHVWTKIGALLIQIEEWDSDRKFGAFQAHYAADFEALKKSYRQLAPKIRLLHGIAPQELAGKGDRLVLHVQAELAEQSTELLKNIYDYMSRGLLQCVATYAARASRLAALGFDISTMSLKSKLTIDQLMILFLAIMSVLLPGVMIFYLGQVSVGETLNQAAMISMIYCVAVVCAVYPKDRWEFARRHHRSMRPAAFYVTAGLLATGASLVIRFAFQLLIFHQLQEAWIQFRLASPWSLCAFVAAFMMAWMTDDRPSPRLPRNRLRWVEGISGAAALALTSLIVVNWVVQVTARLGNLAHVHHPPPTLPLAMVVPGAIGFALGYLIPTWYREAPRDSAIAADADLPELAGAGA